MILALHFYPASSRINKNTIKPGTYKRGTAKLTPNASKLVNKLWVKGGKAISELYTQNVTVGTEAIPLHYSPRAPITITIGGVTKTFGIQNIHEAGVYDFLLNESEKLLVPDLCTSGTGTISYCYEYPIKILLEDPESQKKHGIFEDKHEVNTDDKTLAFELGLKHLFRYSEPVISGSIEPVEGTYRAGELVKVEIPDLNIDQYLRVSEASYESEPLSKIKIKLTLETPERDLSNVLKDMKQRLEKLERETLRDDEGPIERYVAREDIYSWAETAVKTDPIGANDWEFWTEDVSESSHLLLLPLEILYPSFAWSTWLQFRDLIATSYLDETDNLYPSDTLYP